MSVDVSIIIAAYNVAPYIERAIRSALDQLQVSVEVIVVDDASTDGTWEIITELNDSRVKKWRMNQNVGPSAARNFALSQATGAWVAVLDGDDRFLLGRLRQCLDLAQAKQAEIVVDNISVLDESTGRSFDMFSQHLLSRMEMMSVAQFIGGNSNFMSGHGLGYLKPIISVEFIARHGLRYDESLRIGEDYVLMLEALALGARCAVKPTAGYRYTARVGSISHRLTAADVTRIQASDAQFFAKYKVNAAAMDQQVLREQNLEEAYHYNAMLAALKQRDVRLFLSHVRQCPRAARHLRDPLKIRLARMTRAIDGGVPRANYSGRAMPQG